MRISHSTILLKFGRKVPLQKLRNRSLSWRIGPWWFCSSLKGLNWLNLASRCFRARTRKSNYEDACLLWENSEGEAFFISSVLSAWFLQVTFWDLRIAICVVGYCRWWSRWLVSSTKESATSLSFHWYVIKILYIFHQYKCLLWSVLFYPTDAQLNCSKRMLKFTLIFTL